ncbi:MAG: transglutaminase family protein [bacterium]|nr:transglutaminase family protein [bacterium]
MNRYHIVHKTIYKYQKPVTLSHNEGHLLPCDTEDQICESAALRVDPAPAVSDERRDIYGNRVNYFSLEEPHKLIEVVAESWIRRSVTQRVPLDAGRRAAAAEAAPAWENARDELTASADAAMLQEYVFASPMITADAIDSPGVDAFARSVFTPGRSLLAACIDLNARIFNEFQYDSGFSTIGTPLSKVLKHKRGVCQDFAHLFLACVRRMGLPGRYASGYLETKPPPGRPRLQGADASHAWASVFIPGPDGGWLDFDPTNNLIAGNEHIVLGYGRDYSDVTPLKGVIFGGGKHTVRVEVDVIPVED